MWGFLSFVFIVAAMVALVYRAGVRQLARADAALELEEERKAAVKSGALYEPIKRESK